MSISFPHFGGEGNEPPIEPREFGWAKGMTSEPTVYRGRIKWFSPIRHFGFIIADHSNTEIFFHQSNLYGLSLGEVVPQMPVYYTVRFTSKGQEACSVHPVESPSAPSTSYRPSSGEQMRLASTSRWMEASESGLFPRFFYAQRRRSELRPVRRFRCYNCGQYASHKAAFCPFEPMRRCCYRCRSSTHLLKDCPFQQASFLPRAAGIHPAPYPTAAAAAEFQYPAPPSLPPPQPPQPPPPPLDQPPPHFEQQPRGSFRNF